jgi:hypothetical protein
MPSRSADGQLMLSAIDLAVSDAITFGALGDLFFRRNLALARPGGNEC